MDSETVTERYERMAAAFYAETGMMAPGKDDALGHHPYEMRLARWQEWLTARDPQPRPAAPHAAPREGEPEPDAPFRDHDYPSAARSIALNLAEFCDESLPYPAMIADAARRAASRLASQQAALDAAGEDTKRLNWLLSEGYVPVMRHYTDGTWWLGDTGERDAGSTPREAIDAARASHPEAE